MNLEVMCLDCEETWNPDYQPPSCLCDDPPNDAWILFIRDPDGKWVKATLEAIDVRHYMEMRRD